MQTAVSEEKKDPSVNKALHILAALSNHINKHKNCKCCNNILMEGLKHN